MNRKIILAVAPVGNWGWGKGNPLSPEEVAAEVEASAAEGATVYHIHARDASGGLTRDLSLFSRTAELVHRGSDLLLEASTGGFSGFTAAERVLPVSDPRARLGALNLGSINFGEAVFANSLPQIRYWIEIMRKAGVVPTLEIFDTGNLEAAGQLVSEGLLTPPLNFSFVFNLKWGMPFDPALLEYLKSRLPAGSRWGAIFIGSVNFHQHLLAAHQGAHLLRVGLEDSPVLKGNRVRSNTELVGGLRRELERAGFAITDREETAALLLPKNE